MKHRRVAVRIEHVAAGSISDETGRTPPSSPRQAREAVAPASSDSCAHADRLPRSLPSSSLPVSISSAFPLHASRGTKCIIVSSTWRCGKQIRTCAPTPMGFAATSSGAAMRSESGAGASGRTIGPSTTRAEGRVGDTASHHPVQNESRAHARRRGTRFAVQKPRVRVHKSPHENREEQRTHGIERP